jgi:hypothetical protein
MNVLPGVNTLTAKVTSISSSNPAVAPPDPCSGDPVQQGGKDEGHQFTSCPDVFVALKPKKVVVPGLFGSGTEQ